MPIRNNTRARSGRHGKHNKPPLTERQEIDARYRKAIERSVKKHGQGAHWYALRVRPGKEIFDGYRLVKKGMAVFVLFGKVFRRANRFSKDKQDYYYNKVPGWILFGVPSGVDGKEILFNAGMLKNVRGMGNKYARIHPEDIARWAKAMKVPGFHAPDEHATMVTNREFGEGDKVEVLDGPFTGHVLTAKDVGGETTKAEGEFFGSLRVVMVANSNLVRVG